MQDITRQDRAAHIAAQFRYARFTSEGYLRDQALMRRIDATPCITFGDFRTLAKREGWTVDTLVAEARGEIDEPKRTLEHILKSGPVTTVIPYTCLIRLYQKTTAASTQRKPTGKVYCADGCGRRVIGRQKFATDACRKRVARKTA